MSKDEQEIKVGDKVLAPFNLMWYPPYSGIEIAKQPVRFAGLYEAEVTSRGPRNSVVKYSSPILNMVCIASYRANSLGIPNNRLVAANLAKPTPIQLDKEDMYLLASESVDAAIKAEEERLTWEAIKDELDDEGEGEDIHLGDAGLVDQDEVNRALDELEEQQALAEEEGDL